MLLYGRSLGLENRYFGPVQGARAVSRSEHPGEVQARADKHREATGPGASALDESRALKSVDGGELSESKKPLTASERPPPSHETTYGE